MVRLRFGMDERYLNIWRCLLPIALGLMLVDDFARVSDALADILSGAALAILLAFSGSYFWHQRRERQADRSSGAATEDPVSTLSPVERQKRH